MTPRPASLHPATVPMSCSVRFCVDGSSVSRSIFYFVPPLSEFFQIFAGNRWPVRSPPQLFECPVLCAVSVRVSAVVMYTIKSTGHPGRVRNAVRQNNPLTADDSFTDCTLLSSDGRRVRVHRLVLSINSPFLAKILENHNSPEPVITIAEVPYFFLEVLIQFMYSGCAATMSKEDMTYVLNLGINLQVKKMSTIDHVTMNVIQYIKKSKTKNDQYVIDKNVNIEDYRTDLDDNSHFVVQDIDLKKKKPCKVQKIIKEKCKKSTISSIENSIKLESSEYYNSTNTFICTNFKYTNVTTDSNDDSSMEAIGMKNETDKTVNDLVTNNSSKFQITNRRVSVGVFSCDVCHRTYTAKPGLSQHKKFECQLKPTFRCSYCLKMFFRKSSLNRHYVSVHKILMFPTKSKQLLKKIDTYNNA